MSEPVVYEGPGDDSVATVTLSRPEKRNALDPDTIEALGQALERAANDDAAHVILLASTGVDFCAGLDIGHLEATLDAGRDELVAEARQLGDLFIRMRWISKPIIAVVQGRALGGGAGLVTASDLVVAADNAQIGYPEVQIGFVPAIVMTMLIRSVGEKQAFDLVTNGRAIDAAEAHRIGLFNYVVAGDELADAARTHAAGIAGRPASSVAHTKGLIYALGEVSFDEGIARAIEVNAEARQGEAFRAGVREFLRQRKERKRS